MGERAFGKKWPIPLHLWRTIWTKPYKRLNASPIQERTTPLYRSIIGIMNWRSLKTLNIFDILSSSSERSIVIFSRNIMRKKLCCIKYRRRFGLCVFEYFIVAKVSFWGVENNRAYKAPFRITGDLRDSLLQGYSRWNEWFSK